MIDSHSAMSQHKRMLIPDPRDIPAQRDQSQPSGPMALNVPPLQEENPRVKCRDCGAFGHRSRSRRCPIKCGPWHLVPQPLETREEKENQDPHRAQALQNPGTISQAEIDKNLSQHPALHKDRQTPNLSLSAPGKKPAQGPTHPRPNPPKKPRLALCKPQEESSARNDSKASSTERSVPDTIKSLEEERPGKEEELAGQEPSTGLNKRWCTAIELPHCLADLPLRPRSHCLPCSRPSPAHDIHKAPWDLVSRFMTMVAISPWRRARHSS
ncbi:putative protein FAM90A12P [Onychomys torridus]|uniref:putative protein FAM90A12P n=1 Tax=Onychomys torridus TaxID=38674 RepID=UPI00167FC24C|nr:putative protein FAM90A12P [Onychomys torridus]